MEFDRNRFHALHLATIHYAHTPLRRPLHSALSIILLICGLSVD